MAKIPLEVELVFNKSQVKKQIEAVVSKAKVSPNSFVSGMQNNAAGPKGGMGMLRGLGNLDKLVPIAAGIGLIVASSKALQKVLEGIGKMLMMLLRPIGDMLAALFMPLMMLIKPLAVFINALFRPYIQEARKNFRTAMKFYGMGMKEKGNEAMFTGLQLMAAPLIKLLVIAIGEGLKAAIDVITLPFEIFLDLFKGFGEALQNSGIPGLTDMGNVIVDFTSNVKKGVEEVKTQAKDLIDSGIEVVLSGIDNWGKKLIAQGEVLQAEADFMEDLVGDMKDNQVSTEDIKKVILAADKAAHEDFKDTVKAILTGEGGLTEFNTKFQTEITTGLTAVTTKVTAWKTEINSLMDQARAANDQAQQNARLSNIDRSQFENEPDYLKGFIETGQKILGIPQAQKIAEKFKQEDFISRPGAGVVPFSSNDTIVGVKDAGSLGGSYSFNVSINNPQFNSDKDVERMAERLAELTRNKLRGKVSYF